MKLKVYPAVIGVLALGLVAVLVSRLEITVQTETAPSDVPTVDISSPSPVDDLSLRSPLSTEPSIAPASPADPQFANASPPPANVTLEGKLRVSNPTSHPVRVALLSLQAGDMKQAETGDRQTYSEPVHWDFAPGEGSQKGLILSLPDGEVQIQTGDVLVAFAQDGSRQYWGPYVLGQTDLPAWNGDRKEWQLILRP